MMVGVWSPQPPSSSPPPPAPSPKRRARRGLIGPSYRGPAPARWRLTASLRRPDGAVVSIRLQGRPRGAVIADMIEGVVVCNELRPPAADRVRTELWSAIDASTRTAAA